VGAHAVTNVITVEERPPRHSGDRRGNRSFHRSSPEAGVCRPTLSSAPAGVLLLRTGSFRLVRHAIRTDPGLVHAKGQARPRGRRRHVFPESKAPRGERRGPQRACYVRW
jgi:hypothetical protein